MTAKGNQNRKIKTSRAPRRSNRPPAAVGAHATGRKRGCLPSLTMYAVIVAGIAMLICC